MLNREHLYEIRLELNKRHDTLRKKRDKIEHEMILIGRLINMTHNAGKELNKDA